MFHGPHLEIPPFLGMPVVVTIHDVIPLEHPDSMPSRTKRAIYRSLLRIARRRADAVIAPSDQTAESLESIGFDQDRIRVVPLSAASTFRPLNGHEIEQARRSFAGGRPYVSSIVTDKAHKNRAGLLEVAKKVHAETGLDVLVRGPGPDAEGCRHVPLLDDEQLRMFLGGSSLHLSTSLMEGFGLPVMEAAACGVPVVCGGRLGVVDYLEGLVIGEPSDASAMSELVIRLLRDEAERTDLSVRIRASAERWDLDRFSEATASVYESVTT